MVDERSDQDRKRVVVTFEVDLDLKRWLELQAADRIVEGRPFGERSVGAVVRDIVDLARAEAESAELAVAS